MWVIRMLEDRWEYKLLFGRVKKDEEMDHMKGRDLGWDSAQLSTGSHGAW